MMAAPRILIMAGGTGGHVFPALAVAQVLEARGWLVDWVGTARGLESRVVPAHGFTLHTLPVQGLRGKGLLFRVKSLVALIASFVASLSLLLKVKPRAVLGFGGYASGPAGVAAFLLRRPLVVHEQNAVAGTTNRWLAPVAKQVLLGLPGAFKIGAGYRLMGNPVRAEISALYDLKDEIPNVFNIDRPMRLLVVGGSLGSSPLNSGVPNALARLPDESLVRLQIRHQCGGPHVEATQNQYGSVAAASIQVLPFIEDMAAAYRWADLVVCRSGALTVSELMVTGTASVLVPLPHAIDDHQTHNARILSASGAGCLLPQDSSLEPQLSALLQGFIASPQRLKTMTGNARSLAMPNAAVAVAEAIEEVSLVH
ncbi:MAG: undecaprenyldiphospho-muramoylpentapeptide beta-N-acetylglucosaminyltransferase [Luminiphilus sp.]|nr:undecaprenyldiphospho-muramoylpentapeptide beta-N-acetylglucosaminyltransferase [Luminiphilus sp.]